MSTSLCCFASGIAGSATMAAFGAAMRSHNEFLGYSGNFDEAAKACFKTSGVFLVISGVSFVAFVVGAVKSKLSPPAPSVEYTAV